MTFETSQAETLEKDLTPAIDSDTVIELSDDLLSQVGGGSIVNML